MTTTLSLRVEHLSVAYRGRKVLDRVSMPLLEAGQVVALAGPNGAGKSTFLKALAGLIPSTGRALLNGRDCLQWSAQNRAEHIGFMPQTLPHNTGLTVLESTLTALRGANPGIRREHELKALQVIDNLGIGELSFQPLSQLSGGQKQLAALAQAVVRDSPLLLLDEPVSALDLAHQWQVMEVTRRLADEGRLVVVVLHDLTLAARWADQIAILHRGHIHSFGPPVEVINTNTLSAVWGVRARVRLCEQGKPYVLVDGPAQPQPDTLHPLKAGIL